MHEYFVSRCPRLIRFIPLLSFFHVRYPKLSSHSKNHCYPTTSSRLNYQGFVTLPLVSAPARSVPAFLPNKGSRIRPKDQALDEGEEMHPTSDISYVAALRSSCASCPSVVSRHSVYRSPLLWQNSRHTPCHGTYVQRYSQNHVHSPD